MVRNWKSIAIGAWSQMLLMTIAPWARAELPRSWAPAGEPAATPTPTRAPSPRPASVAPKVAPNPRNAVATPPVKPAHKVLPPKVMAPPPAPVPVAPPPMESESADDFIAPPPELLPVGPPAKSSAHAPARPHVPAKAPHHPNPANPATAHAVPAFAAASQVFGQTDFSVSGQALTFLPDGRRILVHGGGGTRGGQVELRELISGRRLAAIGPVAYSNAVSRDGSWIATGGASLILTDARTNRVAKTFPGSAPAVVPLAFSPDATLLAVAENAPKKKGLVLVRISGKGSASSIPMKSPENLEYGSAAFSPNGKWVAAGCQSFGVGACPIHIYDAEKGTRLVEFIAHQQGVRGLSFSADGRTLVSVAHDSVILWNLQTRRPRILSAEMLLPAEHQPRLWSAALSPDTRTLVVGTDEWVLLIDAAKGQVIRRIRPAGLMVAGLSFSLDGSVFGSISGATLELWDARTASRRGGPERHSGRVETVRWAGAGRVLSHGPDNKFKVWDVASGRLEKEVESPYPSVAPAGDKVFLRPARWMELQGAGFAEKRIQGVDPDLNLAGWCPDRSLVIAEQVTRSVHQYSRVGARQATLKLGQTMNGLNAIRAIECRGTQGQQRLFVGGGSFKGQTGSVGDTGFLGVWDPPKNKWTKMHSRLTLPIVKFTPLLSGRTYAIANSANEYAVYEAVTGLEVSHVPSANYLLYSSALSPTGELMAFGGEKGTVLLWNLDTSKFQVLRGAAVDGQPGVRLGPSRPPANPMDDQELKRTPALVYAVEFSSNGSRLFSSRPEGGVDVWNMPLGKRVAALGRAGEKVTSLSVSPDQRWLLAGLADGTLRIWDLRPLPVWVAPPVAASMPAGPELPSEPGATSPSKKSRRR